MQNYDLVRKKKSHIVYKRYILFILFLEENFRKEYNFINLYTIIFPNRNRKITILLCVSNTKGHLGKIHWSVLIISKSFQRIKNRALKEKSHTSFCRINLKIVQSKTVRKQFLKSDIKKCFSYEKSFCISTVLRGQLYRTSHKLEFLTIFPTLAAMAYSNLTETGETSSLNRVKMLSWSARKKRLIGKTLIYKTMVF